MKFEDWFRSTTKLNKPTVIQHPPLGGPVPGPYFAVSIIHHKDGGQLPNRNTPGLVGFLPVFNSREDAAAYFGDDAAVHELLPFMVKTPSKWK